MIRIKPDEHSAIGNAALDALFGTAPQAGERAAEQSYIGRFAAGLAALRTFVVCLGFGHDALGSDDSEMHLDGLHYIVVFAMTGAIRQHITLRSNQVVRTMSDTGGRSQQRPDRHIVSVHSGNVVLVHEAKAGAADNSDVAKVDRKSVV